ncbi:NAD-dependent epimerase/dehydratase family protein [Mastigocoleus sp. MO_188.B34]|uniref:NAD-dependent epimerase/dehydratase family protein n=1 Tax=Mastigocoleus sp. MO_188.B34 TaxID=3036635 RepID=UPI0026121329|nr:NAD-dependent epimerase/dehydratase family protein [Mastigocoleus sp. MO_188.B34]MDJ0693048.1 NAD-dependent epimerase/dehydratase family protein [Mastigocoleus sp. MO_188.B34]
MKALVTGANGFTGSHLVKALEKCGDRVVGLVRKSSNLARLDDTQIQLVYGDITDRNALRKAMQEVDTVFHTAAYVELGLVDEQQMERVNVDGTQAVLEIAKEIGVSKIVYCSTIGVYGDTQGKVVNETFRRTQQDFSSAYDRTKYQAQKLVDKFAADGLSIISIMPSGILGVDDPHFGPVFKLFLKGWLKLWLGGDRMTGIVHVDDLVNAMILAAERGQSGEHYIISAGDLPTREMFEIISQETDINVPIEVPQPIVRFVASLLDPIGKLLNWNPPIGRERVHYLYERCVRVDATKARKELGWKHQPVNEILKEIVKQLQISN